MATDEKTDVREDSTFEVPSKILTHYRIQRLNRVVEGVTLLLLLLYIGFPVVWLFLNTFKGPGALLQNPYRLIPAEPTLAIYERLFFDTLFLTYFKNSVIVAAGSVAISVTLCTLAGYGLARSEFEGKTNLARTVLFAYMFPAILLGIPLYIIFYNFGLLDSYVALIFAHAARTTPFGIWIMWQYYQSLPVSYEEAAWINGASQFRTIRDVVVPLSLPGILVVAVLNFAASWNDYTFATIIMTEPTMQTLPPGIDLFKEGMTVEWGLLLSAGSLMVLPGAILIALIQKHLIQGFNLS